MPTRSRTAVKLGVGKLRYGSSPPKKLSPEAVRRAARLRKARDLVEPPLPKGVLEVRLPGVEGAVRIRQPGPGEERFVSIGNRIVAVSNVEEKITAVSNVKGASIGVSDSEGEMKERKAKVNKALRRRSVGRL